MREVGRKEAGVERFFHFRDENNVNPRKRNVKTKKD